MGGSDMSSTPRFFICRQYQTTFRQLRNGRFSPNLALTRESVMKRRFWREIYEKFLFRAHLPSKPPNLEGKNRYLTQSRLQITGCTAERYCLLCIVVQGPESFRCRSTFLYDVRLRSYGASKLPKFWILAYFSYIKRLKSTFRWPAYSPGVTSQNDSIFPCDSRRSKGKGVPFGSGVFLRLLVGELWTPKLAQIFAYGKWLYPCRMLLHGASDLDQRCLNTRNSEDRCTFPPNIFAFTPKITPKLHFVGPFNAKPHIQRDLRKSHVNGATKLKLYSYVGIGKYSGMCMCKKNYR